MTDTKRVLIGAEINAGTRDTLLEIAAARGEGWTFSAVVRTALDAYAKGYRRRKPPRPDLIDTARRMAARSSR